MVLFAKAPVPGRVKTRLVPLLGPQSAADLHAAFVRDMLEKLDGLRDIADLELHTDIPTDAWSGLAVATRIQCTGDLALKMLHALGEHLREGRPQVMVIGSDSPDLPASHLGTLLDARADVALGPCADGGFYAICCRAVHPLMFHGVEWSSSGTLVQAERAVQACGLAVERGQSWYDVDEPSDLERLLHVPNLPRHTAIWQTRTFPT
jgi:rSAM/selenodomain-associated transferase 1